MTNKSAPGMYNLEELTKFDQRQAWSHNFSTDPHDATMLVGEGEQVMFSRTLTRQPLGDKIAAQDALINTLIMTGQAPMDYRLPFRRLRTSIILASKGINRLPSGADPSKVIEALASAESFTEDLETEELRNTISRAAGYIAARSNLWVVTDSAELKDTHKPTGTKVNVAKLLGIGINNSERAVPVVAGKNQKVTKLDPPEKLRSVEWGNFRTLTVVKSTATS